jgi:hypothetical protein
MAWQQLEDSSPRRSVSCEHNDERRWRGITFGRTEEMSIAARCTCDRKGSGFAESDGYCPRHGIGKRPIRSVNNVERHPNCIYPLCGCGSTADCKSDPLNTPLPCDVQVGQTTFRKGVALRSLVLHANRLRDELHSRWAGALADATDGVKGFEK